MPRTTQRHFRVRAMAFALVLASMLAPAANPATAGDADAPGADLLFGRAHLAAIEEPRALHYAFVRDSRIEGMPSFSDTIVEHVAPDTEKRAEGRSVTVDFFTGPRRSPVPNFRDYTTNPMVMIFLQRDIGELGRIVKADPNFLKNRIRFALRDAKAEAVEVAVGERMVDAWRIAITPFAQDELRKPMAEFAERRYEFVVSGAVPGEIVSIAAITPADAERAAAAGSQIETLLVDTVTFTRDEASSGKAMQ